MDKQHSISIDGWQIDSVSYRITRDGVEKKLEPRSMDLLLYLAERPNEVVTRQEIEESVWQGRVVGYDALSSSIAKIRKAFDDTGKNHRVIETISKAGYRLIAPVLIEVDEDIPIADEPAGENFERKLTAIFYADVAGYSRLTGQDEDRTHRQLRDNMKIISEAIVSFQGRVIHYAGDAVLADFSMASNALHCALDVQQKISEIGSALSDNQRVLFRIGVNLGEVIVDGVEIYGDGVNVAARLESLAEPGGVCISGSVFDAIGQKQRFEFEYHGEKSVKNIERPVRTYAVHLKPGASIPVPDSLSRLRSHPGQRFNSKPVIVFVVCLLIVLLGVGIYLGKKSDGSGPATDIATIHYDTNMPSLAIVPFANMSNDPGQTVYADGLTDDLITDLSNIDGLLVTPRHSSFLYRNKNLPVPDIARQLQVRYVVQGSFRRSLGDVRVSVQLVDSQSDEQIWAGRFDDKIENVFKLQDQIISKILEKINLQPDTKPKSKRRTTNLEAYDYFLRAEHRRLNNSGLVQSDEILRFYRRAIELDPSFVAAYTGLAREALTNWQLDASQVMPGPTSRRLVYDSAGKALELDPESADALAILGLMQAISGAHDTGLASVKRAVAIDPENPQLHADLAEVLSYSGAHEQALESINTAIDRHVTPPSVFFAERARIYFFLGRFENALSDLEKAKGTSVWKNFYAFVYGALNDRESAMPYVDARLEIVPFENLQSYWVDFAYYRRPADIELLIDSAAKAGIPRFAYGFDPGERQSFDDEAIAELIGKGLWRGHTYGGNEIFQQFTGSSGVAIRTPGTMLSGSYFLKKDKLCVTFSDELPDCGYVYPGSTSNEFTWVTLGDVYQFSTGH